MAEMNIIKSFRKKGQDGSYGNPSFFGSDLRFVGASRNSHNNNFEEQTFIGTDCVTTEWVDELGVQRTTKEFHNSSSANPVDYYILDTSIFDEGSQNSDFYFQDGKLLLPGDATVNEIREDGLGVLTYFGEDVDIYMISEDEDDVLINPSFSTVRQDTLRYKQSTGAIVDVSKKLTQVKYSNDGTKKITKEIIVNYL